MEHAAHLVSELRVARERLEDAAERLEPELKSAIGEGPKLFRSEFGQNSVKIHELLCRKSEGTFARKFKTFRNFEFSIFSRISAKFRQNFIKI